MKSLFLTIFVFFGVVTFAQGAGENVNAVGQRPLVLIDEAHFNYPLVEASDKPFAAFLQENGYRVSSLTVPFEKESLDTGQVLIIAMPLAERNRIRGNPEAGWATEDWSLPNPSAFSDHEIAVIKSWVVDGGSLLVIFDHMPFAGAVAELAGAFGIEVSNGHARDSVTGPMIFSRSNGTLIDHVITNGFSPAERIESVATFGGAAFRSDADLEPILVFGPSVVSFTPDVAHQITDETRRISVNGWFQGAVGTFGHGRAAFFGEAGMFFAVIRSLSERDDCGEDCWTSVAEQNPQLLLNVLGWLSEFPN